MTGTVDSLAGEHNSYCFIVGDDSVRYYAHRTDFVEKTAMATGVRVVFLVKQARNGKNPAATDVTALQLAA